MKKIIYFGLVFIGLATTSCKSTIASTISTPISVSENIRPLDADITVDVNKKNIRTIKCTVFSML